MIKTSYQPIRIEPPQHRFKARDDKWFHAGPDIDREQGWKVYVSATLLCFPEILDTVAEIFAHNDIAFKYVCSDKSLRKLNAGLYGYSQVGKPIVGYFTDNEKLREVVGILKVRLDKFRHLGTEVPFAEPLGGGLPLYYRFGSFSGGQIEIDGKVYDDDRTRPASWVFEHAGDPLAALKEDIPVDAAFETFLQRFPVYEVLGQGGKGGVFAAFDLEADAFDDLILKVGYRNGQILPDGRDGMALIAAEARFFRLLEKYGIPEVAPAFHGFHEFESRSALVMSRVDGKSLMRLHLDDELKKHHIAECLALLDRIHGAGLYVGDSKIANFVGTPDGGVHAIDFECAGELVNARQDMLCTFHFSRPQFSAMAELEKAHLLYSIIHKEMKNTFSESDRIIDLMEYIADFKANCEVEEFALKELAAMTVGFL